MSWWVALIPAIAVLIQALPYLIGGYMGFEVFKLILENPTALLAIIAGIMGAYLIYKKQLKYGMVLLVAALITYYIPLISGTLSDVLSIFSNPFVLIISSTLIMVYYLASRKQLNKTTMKYLILGMVAALLVSVVASSIGTAGGPGPGFNYYMVTFECVIERPILPPGVKPHDLRVLEMKGVKVWYPGEVEPLVFWEERKDFVLSIYRNDFLVFEKKYNVKFGWWQTIASKNVTVCLRKGKYNVKLCTPESGKCIERIVEVGVL